MEKILISACLVGELVRYNAERLPVPHPLLQRWHREGRLVPVCPEVDGGLPVPRPPAEIVGGAGEEVLAGTARVLTAEGKDVSPAFLFGAHHALRVAREQGIKLAILKERSPSCGSHEIYDGTFSGARKPGRGVTAALLERHGIRVFSEEEIEAAGEYLAALEEGAE
ncbi:MAG: DUF523 domain-containing protein [Calditrichaeota bacterium]|nr:MAG: DUF523 domain-containing protein [Calditrichota bacterium]